MDVAVPCDVPCCSWTTAKPLVLMRIIPVFHLMGQGQGDQGDPRQQVADVKEEEKPEEETGWGRS